MLVFSLVLILLLFFTINAVPHLAGFRFFATKAMVLASLGFSMPHEVHNHLSKANIQCNRRKSPVDGKRLAKVLHATFVSLRVRSSQLNVQSLYWAIYLQSATISSCMQRSMEGVGFVTTEKTAIAYLTSMGKAFNHFLETVSRTNLISNVSLVFVSFLF